MNNSNTIKHGIAFSVLARWSDRIIGISSTIILARLLAPNDFGIIAISAIVIALADTLFNLGAATILIQKSEPSDDEYSTAWSIRLVQTLIATSVVIFSSGFFAQYFNVPELSTLLPVLSLSILLSGLENIWIISFQKKIQFNLEFRFLFTRRLVGFLFTIVLAYSLQSYWALVFGTLIMKGTGVALSYLMHKRRPRVNFSRSNEMLSISFWLLLNSIGAFLNNNLHKALIGKYNTPAITGKYTISDEIASLPTSELLAPINRVIFPALSNAKNNPEQLKKIFLLTQSYQTLIAIPAGLGLAAVAPELIPFMLGEKWVGAVVFVQLLAAYNIIQAVGTSFGYTLLALGKNKLVTLDCWVQLALFLAITYTYGSYSNAEDLIKTRLLVALITVAFSGYLILRSVRNIKFTEIISNIIRPITGGLIMVYILLFYHTPFFSSSLLIIIEKVILGALFYSVAVTTAWIISGRPSGAEKQIIDFIARFLKNRKPLRLP